MFIILLKFADKSGAPALMQAHNDWIEQNFKDGVFLATGSLQPAMGGAIFASGLTRQALEARIAEDPFVAKGVVLPEIFEVSLARTDPRLEFLKA
jgi:uncharacterized protein YciI